MNAYPDRLPLKSLEGTYSCYSELAPVWNKINLLTNGGYLLESSKEEFLPQRAGEPESIYQTRIKKFTYRNLLGSSIQQQSSKLTAGSYSIAGLDSDPKFWEAFRENVDLRGTSESDFLPKLFREALKFGTLYIHVDKPITQVQPINKQQEKLLGLRPYLTLYSAQEVTDYEEDRFGNLTFLKVRQVSQYRPTPFSNPIDQVTWTWITPEVILKYSALVKFDRNGNILSLLSEEGTEISVSDETTIPLASLIETGLNQLPVIRFNLPCDLWIANQIYLKCLEHLNLDNLKYDFASIASYVQRVYRPYTVNSDQIPDLPGDEPIQSGNPYILTADSFEFAEMQGTALTVISDILNALEKEIRDMIALGITSSTKEAVQQSGISKKFDLYREELTLRAYGKLILNCYQDILQLVAVSQGIDPTPISMSGYDSFELDSADDLLLTGEELLKLRSLLPPTTLKLFSKQLCAALSPNASAEEKAMIEAEIDQMDFESSPIEPQPTTPLGSPM